MALVDYSSDSSESEEDVSGPQPKKQKLSHSPMSNRSRTSLNPVHSKSGLPPLPSAFHDLYASTVRVSASDDPTLHQGRKRVNPHKVGSWPSHLYIEWHPTQSERNILSDLLSQLQSRLTFSSSTLSLTPNSYTPDTDNPITITSFLTSDLGTPQPLHISLSRPIVLSTAQKDTFLTELESSIGSGGVAPFDLVPLGLEWHRTEESARSFLVLRVGSTTAAQHSHLFSASSLSSSPSAVAAAASQTDSKSKNGEDYSKTKPTAAATVTNPELTTLLRRSNALVTSFGQPALYAFSSTSTSTSTSSSAPARRKSSTSAGASIDPGSDADTGAATATNTDVDRAFHISIAWSFAIPDPPLRRVTEEVFNSTTATIPVFDDNHNNQDPTNSVHQNRKDKLTKTTSAASSTRTTIKGAVTAMRVRVDGIKAKIGNVVTHIPLPDAKRRSRLLNGGVGGIMGGGGGAGARVGVGEGGKTGKGGLFGII